MGERMAIVPENGKRVVKNLSEVDILEESVYKFKNFAEISKGQPSEKVKIGLPESLAKTNVFRDIFCDHPFRQGTKSSQVPIYFDLELIQNAWKEIQFDENGNPNFDSLKNGKYEKYIPALRNIAEVCMPYLSVKENPNKFLKLALDYRKKNMVNVKFNDFVGIVDRQPINSPTFPLYIGLDRIAQFLNFCVLINSLSTKKENGIKKVEPLSFEKKVLNKLLDQVNAAKEDLKDLIKKCSNRTLDEYKEELDGYRRQYDDWVKNNQTENIFDALTFVEWMDNRIRKTEGKNYSGLVNSFNDKTKLDILLYLDSILQCRAAIDKFIDKKALESSILNWFQGVWDSIKLKWNFFASKMGLSQKWLCNTVRKIEYMELKKEEIIPNLDLRHEKPKYNKGTNSDLKNMYYNTK